VADSSSESDEGDARGEVSDGDKMADQIALQGCL
jgi:hypothetical protein